MDFLLARRAFGAIISHYNGKIKAKFAITNSFLIRAKLIDMTKVPSSISRSAKNMLTILSVNDVNFRVEKVVRELENI